MSDDLVVLRPQGLYCPPGDFWIDPWRRVDRAIVTHAHADHARSGHGHYLATAVSAGVLRARLGDIRLQGLAYGEVIEHHGVRVSLHPAGHVLGSAQVRLEHGGRVWVASGDYHLRGDAPPGEAANPTCDAFEPVRCDTFITESTFGLPIYRWRPEAEVFGQIDAWWRDNAAAGRPSLLQAYSFGKAQRLLAGVDPAVGPIAVHPTVDAINRAYRDAGVDLPATRRIDDLSPAERGRALLITPPSARQGLWLGERADAGPEPAVAFASGWMAVRSARRRPGLDRGFVLSDHADWPGLQRAIAATGAERVIVTHGQEEVMVRWLREQGLDAGRFPTPYGQDEASDND
ncbi:ligase-associated DNA damage response exonuclease [Sphaerotilus mobilis]|uniref:Putative mRNA 3-end processing factor n=1 Tax=Sphaerotilus mobilis TaxID=47994 RepID=A0A4Q7LSN6_9BURK|nr:ligase-associated DNA damage response exonuclease [Sphaerotilus mobilis]RZS57865.1 putative mRNA 3-end processing factor [Sphaerotilus mobilis]